MFAAQLHRKLNREEESLEDLLTSNVFGIWRYLPAEAGLFQFLSTARNAAGAKLLVERADRVMTFWPWLTEKAAHRVQPDLLIEIGNQSETDLLLLVESKYLSGKSSFPDDGPLPSDQLAREMDNLRRIANRRGIEEYALLYVTADTAFPHTDIQESTEELAAKTGDGDSERFYWTSWRYLPGPLRSCLFEPKQITDPDTQCACDLADVLQRRISLSAFDPTQVGNIHACSMGDLFLRKPYSRPQFNRPNRAAADLVLNGCLDCPPVTA